MIEPMTSTHDQVQPLLTIPAVAELLGVSRPTVYKMIQFEGLPTVRMGKSVRILPTSLLRWLEEREQRITWE